jgi:broad specificity phosphatase PhoE
MQLEHGLRDLELPEGELASDAAQRVMDCLKSALDRFVGNLVLSTHGGPHALICCCALGIPLSHARQFDLEPGATTLLAFDRQSTLKRIVALNTTSLIPYISE